MAFDPNTIQLSRGSHDTREHGRVMEAVAWFAGEMPEPFPVGEQAFPEGGE